MGGREEDRIAQLARQLNKLGVDVDDMLEEGYEAIALHASSTIITCNEATAKIFGYRLEEMEGLNAWTLFAPDSAPILMEHLASRSTTPYRVTARRKDGSTFTAELKGNNFMLAGEEVRSVLLKQVH